MLMIRIFRIECSIPIIPWASLIRERLLLWLLVILTWATELPPVALTVLLMSVLEIITVLIILYKLNLLEQLHRSLQLRLIQCRMTTIKYMSGICQCLSPMTSLDLFSRTSAIYTMHAWPNKWNLELILNLVTLLSSKLLIEMRC